MPSSTRILAQINQQNILAQEIPPDINESEKPPESSDVINNSPARKCPLPDLPSPFKDACIWPSENKKMKKKPRMKEKLPCVVSSDSWNDYHTKKDEAKLALEESKRLKKEERLNKQILKNKEEELRKAAQLVKKAQRAKALEELRVKQEDRKAERESKKLRIQMEKDERQQKKMMSQLPPLMAKAMKKEVLENDNEVETSIPGSISNELVTIDVENETDKANTGGESPTNRVNVLTTPKKRKIEE